MGLLKKKKAKKDLDSILAEYEALPNHIEERDLLLFRCFWDSLMPYQRFAFKKLMKKQLLGGFENPDYQDDAVDVEAEEDDAS